MTDMMHTKPLAWGGEPVLSRWWRTLDKVTLAVIVVLFLLGLFLDLAASQPFVERKGGDPMATFYKQAVFASAAFAVMIGLSILDPVQVRRIGIIGFGIALIALVLVPVMGVSVNGATRWLRIGAQTIQPSEFAKPLLIVLSAWLIGASQNMNGVAMSLGATMIVLLLLRLQPDMGQSALVALGWMVLFFIAGGSILMIGVMSGIVSAVAVLAYVQLPHVQDRVNSFLADDVGAHDQVGVSMRAVQQGGWFGEGMGEGTFKYRLPDAHTDFIFAVAVEEHGLILGLLILALFATVALRSLWRLGNERDPFIRLAGAGLALTFAAQAFVNIGVAVYFLPTTGMTLPLMSFGGSSMLSSGIALGMLLAFTRSRPQGRIEDAFQSRRR